MSIAQPIVEQIRNTIHFLRRRPSREGIVYNRCRWLINNDIKKDIEK